MKQKRLEKMELSCIRSSEGYGRWLWWIKVKPHSCTQHLAPQLSQSYSIHEEVLSLTFGSAFHLQYVQRLQNSHGRTPLQCWRDPATGMMSPTGFVLPSTVSFHQKHQKLLQKKKWVLGLWVFGRIWVVWTRRWLLQGYISRNLPYSPFVM